MASYTTNLNLLKKDPAADASDTFNIKTMLNDNWDKIDTAVGKKVEKKVPAATGNLAALDAAGNLADSGHLPGYFQQTTDGLTAETTLDDADTVPFYDASVLAPRKSTWANLKAKIKTALFGTVSGIPKLDGSGGVSAADAAALKTLLDTLTSVSPATGDKIPLTDISGAAAGYSTIGDVLALVTPGAQIATGSYTGTGTSGSAHPNSLTFSFTPKLLVVMIHSSSDIRFGIFTYQSTVGFGWDYSTYRLLTTSWNGGTVSWYLTDNAPGQLNTSGTVYNYVAIG